MEISPEEVGALIQNGNAPKLLDIREPAEWDVVHLEGARLITQELVDEILSGWEKDTPIICYCHHGVRSLQATAFLRQQGFTNVLSMRGGINAYAQVVDPSLPRY